MGGQDLKGYLKGTLKVPLKGTFERRGRAQPQVKDEQVACFYALTDETRKMTGGFTFACM